MILDEPTSALDASVAAKTLNLLLDLQHEHSMTYLFISHDLNVIRYMCEDVVVMYLGKIVEMGKVKDIFVNPIHPYTQSLLSSIPIPDPQVKIHRIIMKGETPSPMNLPPGCCLQNRCPKAMPQCRKVEPILHEIEGRKVACHIFGLDA
jgi:oligopeptide/dipeptide ABC transporter ATP-binding protein